MKKNLLEYKHVIWDWNGTLFDDVELCWNIINGIILKTGLPGITLGEYLKIFTFPVKDYYRKVGLPVDNGSFEKLGKDFIDEYERRKYDCNLYPRAKPVLERISNAGISQSVLSAYSQNMLEEIIAHFKLTQHFIRLIGLDNIYAASKLENGKNWIGKLGLNRADVLFIGDTDHDFDVAEEMGIDSLLIASGHQTKEKLLTVSTAVVDSLEDLDK